MRSLKVTKSKKIALVIATVSLVLGGVSSANAASKTITCYKGTSVKKVTAASPKCPSGYTTTKPVVKSTAKPVALVFTLANSTPEIAFNCVILAVGISDTATTRSALYFAT